MSWNVGFYQLNDLWLGKCFGSNWPKLLYCISHKSKSLFGKVMKSYSQKITKNALDPFQVFNSPLSFVNNPQSLFLNTEIQKVRPLWHPFIKGFKLSYNWILSENFKLQFSNQHIPGPHSEGISNMLTDMAAQKNTPKNEEEKNKIFVFW